MQLEFKYTHRPSSFWKALHFPTIVACLEAIKGSCQEDLHYKVISDAGHMMLSDEGIRAIAIDPACAEKYLAEKKKVDRVSAGQTEKEIRDRLALALNGRIEVPTPVGRIDILTATELIEVKTVANAKHGFGQLFFYGFYHPRHIKRLHLFGDRSTKLEKELILICGYHRVNVTFEDSLIHTSEPGSDLASVETHRTPSVSEVIDRQVEYHMQAYRKHIRTSNGTQNRPGID